MSPEAQRIEALLFLGGEAVSLAELTRLVDISLKQLETCFSEITDSLQDHGLALVRTSGYIQLTTAPSVSGFIKQYVATDAEELSPAAIETLALIAYRGPVTRPQLDAIRGVDSRRMVRQLLARGLVRKISGEQRVRHYEVTEELLQHLGLTDIRDLPQYELLSQDQRISEHLSRHEHS